MASCHVERPLDDRTWRAFSRLQERRPGGLAVAALMRPPDAEAGEHDDERWLARAREAADRAPLGHHAHFTSPTHARPTGGDSRERVRREGAWLRSQGLRPTLFCGGGWYTDLGVARACAELGYADCTPRAVRPSYLQDGAAWAELASPAVLELDAGTLVVVPTTHAAGDLVRDLVRGRLPDRVHAYFHDTDLLDVRRRAIVIAGLMALGRRRQPTDLNELATEVRRSAPRVAWSDVARGEAAAPPA